MGGKKGFADPEMPDVVRCSSKSYQPVVKMPSRRSIFSIRLLHYQEPRSNFNSRALRLMRKTHYVRGIAHGKYSKGTGTGRYHQMLALWAQKVEGGMWSACTWCVTTVVGSRDKICKYRFRPPLDQICEFVGDCIKSAFD
jgi:hypothetical protein